MKFTRPGLKVEQPKSAFAEGNARWTNKDLDPVPRAGRKWGAISFAAYWISDAFNAATWQFGAGVIAMGLTWRESLSTVAVGFFIISFVISLNGATGVIHHAPFPVLARASWGFWGSYIAIISRVILAIFWFSIQCMNGANSVQVMLGAIWPSFLTLPNHIPKDQGIETNTMVAFFLFWLIQLPFLYMRPNQLKWLFIVKSVVVPPAWIAILIWAFKVSDGGKLFEQEAKLKGAAYSWAWLSNLTATLGNFATLSVNQADFSRYSRVSAKWQAMYVPFLPLVFTFVSFIGIAAASGGQVRYGVLEWDPLALISHWSSRACRFFGAFSFGLAALGVNISANSLSAANDLTALMPRYINIRRGQLMCALFAWALVPWRILASAGSFLNFMSAYSVFLGPIASIMVFDFWLIHSARYDTLALYQPHGIYRYTAGVNWRAWVSFVLGVVPTLPGFANALTPSISVGEVAHIYNFGWLFGFVVTGVFYIGLSYAFPARDSFIERAVLPDEIYDFGSTPGDIIEGAQPSSESDAGNGRGRMDEEK